MAVNTLDGFSDADEQAEPDEKATPLNANTNAFPSMSETLMFKLLGSLSLIVPLTVTPSTDPTISKRRSLSEAN
tara:strand:- start:215 stop:436 length:222 start_codon:yes stop_codon:yes gene_type:complete